MLLHFLLFLGSAVPWDDLKSLCKRERCTALLGEGSEKERIAIADPGFVVTSSFYEFVMINNLCLVFGRDQSAKWVIYANPFFDQVKKVSLVLCAVFCVLSLLLVVQRNFGKIENPLMCIVSEFAFIENGDLSPCWNFDKEALDLCIREMKFKNKTTFNIYH